MLIKYEKIFNTIITMPSVITYSLKLQARHYLGLKEVFSETLDDRGRIKRIWNTALRRIGVRRSAGTWDHDSECVVTESKGTWFEARLRSLVLTAAV
ncbi:hypothetical protein LguiA_027971 [Lonicera macranthoides]